MWLIKLGWSWVTGGGFSVLTDIIGKYQDSKIKSEQLQVQWAMAQLAAMQTIRMATAGFWEMRVMTATIAAVFTSHLVLVWFHTCFGWSITGKPVPKFPAPMDEWQGAIILSFFGLTAGVTSIKAIAAAVIARR